MRRPRNYWLLITFLYLSFMLAETKAWSADRLFPENNSSVFRRGILSLPNFNLNMGTDLLLEKLRFLEDGWSFFNKDGCDVACHIFACLFRRRPSQQEMCQRLHNKEHSCCIKSSQHATAPADLAADRYVITLPYIIEMLTQADIAASAAAAEKITVSTTTSPVTKSQTVSATTTTVVQTTSHDLPFPKENPAEKIVSEASIIVNGTGQL